MPLTQPQIDAINAIIDSVSTDSNTIAQRINDAVSLTTNFHAFVASSTELNDMTNAIKTSIASAAQNILDALV